MRFEPPRAFSVPRPRATPPGNAGLPAEIAFLGRYYVPHTVLRQAATRAWREGVGAARCLLAYGGVSQTLYYSALARWLGVPYVDKWPRPAPFDAAAALARGSVRLVGDGQADWLVAPRDEDVRLLIAARARGIAMPRIAIATPAHFAAIVRRRAEPTLVHAGSHELPDAAPALSAKGVFDGRAKALVGLLGLLCVVAIIAGSRTVLDGLGMLFLAGVLFRLFVSAEGLSPAPASEVALNDATAPFYSVLVPLHDEAGMVPGLVAALDRIDYPRSRLEVLILVEADDKATRAALAAVVLPSVFRVIEVPPGTPRTKPRALNVGLYLARGSLITVYDAEDRPEPDQLRRAAARFARAPASLACLQARLAVANGSSGLLPALFAIEYAALFDLFNVGLARLGLPLALGGTSNHFRAEALRAVGGWDAWNVTEDADLGLRLARFGHAIDVLASTTWEDAPERPSIWFKQRRRWTKGWMQTLLVLARDGRAAGRHFGPARTLVVALMLTNLVTGPLLTPLFLVLMVRALAASGLPTPRTWFEIAESTLAFTVVGASVLSTLWCGWVGLRRRHLGARWFALPALIPYQLLISAAAWVGVIDLWCDPYHWHKTQHGEAARPRPPPARDKGVRSAKFSQEENLITWS